MKEFVSIIIPLYNRGHLIAETLDSVMQQTYPKWECIVVDDGSTDNSVQVVAAYVAKDSRISLLHRLEFPKGASRCRNIGVEKAKGNYVMFLDSDDLLHSQCLEKRVHIFQDNPFMDFLVFNGLLFQNSNDLYGYNTLWNVDSIEKDLFRFLRIDGVWSISGPLYKHSFIAKFPFDERLPFWQDLEIALRILLYNPNYGKYLAEPPDVFIRWHTQDSVSRTAVDQKRRLKEKLAILNIIIKSVRETKYRFRWSCQKQFIFTYYKLSKEVFNSGGSLHDCLNPTLRLLKLFPWGYAFFIILIVEQVLHYFLSKGSGKVITKSRIIWSKFMIGFIYRSLGINESTLYKVKYVP